MDDLTEQKEQENIQQAGQQKEQQTVQEKEQVNMQKSMGRDENTISKEEAFTLAKRVKILLTAPKEAADYIERQPLIIGMAVTLFITALIIFIPQRSMILQMTKAAIENSGQTYSAEELQSLLQGGTNAAMFISMFYFVCTPFFKGGVAYALSTLAGGSGKFKATLGMVVNAYMVMILGQFLRMIVVLATSNPYFSFSAAMLLGRGAQTGSLFSVLSAIDIFSIWYLILSMIGLKKIHALSTVKAFAVTFGPWLMLLAMGLVGVA